MELDYRLTRKQEKALKPLHRIAGKRWSWALTRHEGTGLKFWRLTINNGPEWSGSADFQAEGKTLSETIEIARCIMQ